MISLITKTFLFIICMLSFDCVAPTDIECYTNPSGIDYRGVVAVTVNGTMCQKWAWMSRTFPNAGLGDHNYCRNPDQDPEGVWCITTDPAIPWQFCDIGESQSSCDGVLPTTATKPSPTRPPLTSEANVVFNTQTAEKVLSTTLTKPSSSEANGITKTRTEDMDRLQTTEKESTSPSVGLIAGGISAAVFLILIVSVIVIAAICIQKRRRVNGASVNQVEEGTRFDNEAFSELDHDDIYEDVDDMEYEDVMSSKWDITWENLKLTGDVLGKGNFGEVQLGHAKIKGKWITAAIKTLKPGTPEMERSLFKKEFDIMTSIGYHPNVVNVLGSCEHGGSFYVILEFVHHGNLRKFLRKCRKKSMMEGQSTELSPKQLLNFALGVAKAMNHIADCGIIHRDLAARNVLVGRGYTPKVADFGLSREEDLYVQTSSCRVPTRWLSIESMTKKMYSTKSDVWSFGILLWEIATFGGTPYPDMETRQISYQLSSGYRMPKPDDCKDEMYQLMLQCWHVDADSRPSFKDIVDILNDMVSQDKIYMSTAHYANSSVLRFKYPAVCPEKDDN